MGKNKARKFLENETFKCLVQPEFDEIFDVTHPLKGNWNKNQFSVDQSITLEMGCGRGEYTIDLAKNCLTKNFIGIDIKGARMWHGAKDATVNNITNAAFLRTRIEFINNIFDQNEVSEVWITFPDPQLKKQRAFKRLTSPTLLNQYTKFLKPDAIIQLKTDSQHLHEYTKAVLEHNNIIPINCNNDIYGTGFADPILSIKTTYEKKFLEQGLPITYISFQIPAGLVLTDPLFQPDEELGSLDDNRV